MDDAITILFAPGDLSKALGSVKKMVCVYAATELTKAWATPDADSDRLSRIWSKFYHHVWEELGDEG